MKRREFGLLGVSTAALSAMQATAFAAPAAEAHSHNTGGCAEACSDCQRECDACAHHCAMMLADGHKHHMATLQTCQDCADICATASQVVSREGVMSELICQSCADACAKCAKACRTHGSDDKMMTACASECEKCEKACRDMLKQVAKPATK